MHVSEQGVDTNDGCTPQTATKTLGAALARVATRNIPGLEVHLCRGTYPEGSIRIQTPVVVRGGYNCVDWKRVDGFGARDFVDPNLVKVTSNDPLRRTTLELATTAITASTILEGFMIEGPQGGETGSSTVSVFEGAAPVFRSMQILGGKSSNPSGPGTEGLRVHSGAVEVDRSIITGGNGTGAAGSVGLHAIASSVNVHDSTLDGGTGAAERNGVRAALIETGANMKQVFRQNLIKWGRTIVNTANAALGIYVDGGEVEIEENRILGGDVECNTAPCSVYAIAFANVSSAKVIKNTISGGTLANPGGLPNTVALVGISSRTTPGFIAQGNIIHPGTTGAAGVVAIGIDVSSAFGPQIVGNTILAVAGSAESRGSAVRLSTGAGTGSINAVVEGNIFAGVDRNEDVGLEMASCHGASMSSMKSNLFVTHRRVFVDYSDPSCQPTSLDYPSQMQNYLTPRGTVTTGNIAVRRICEDGAFCVALACLSTQECLSSIFEAWDHPSLGRANAVQNRLRLKPDGRCTINEGLAGQDLLVGKDLYNTPRALPFSMGAVEQDSCLR